MQLSFGHRSVPDGTGKDGLIQALEEARIRAEWDPDKETSIRFIKACIQQAIDTKMSLLEH